MSRIYTTDRGSHIEYSLWLIFDRGGSVRLSRAQPSLGRSEKAVALTVKLPKSLFSEPAYRATLTVDDPSLELLPIDLVAAREALKGALGVDIDLKVSE